MTALVLFYWLKWILLLLMLYIFFFLQLQFYRVHKICLCTCWYEQAAVLDWFSFITSITTAATSAHLMLSWVVWREVTWHRGYCSRFFAMDFNSHIWIHHFGRLTDVSVLDRAQRLTRQEKRILLVKSWSISVFPSNTKQPASRAVSIVYIDLWLFYILTNSLSAVDEMKKDRPCLT